MGVRCSGCAVVRSSECQLDWKFHGRKRKRECYVGVRYKCYTGQNESWANGIGSVESHETRRENFARQNDPRMSSMTRVGYACVGRWDPGTTRLCGVRVMEWVAWSRPLRTPTKRNESRHFFAVVV
jgi:hypothetical protein